MKEFRKPRKIDLEAVKATFANAEGEYAFFTGTVKTNNRRASGRTAVLSLISEKRKPIPLAVLYDRAASKGFDPAFVRGGLALAGLANPAVYFLLYKDGEGAFRAAVNIPLPDPAFTSKPYKRGDAVIAKSGEAAKPAKPAKPTEVTVASLPAPKPEATA